MAYVELFNESIVHVLATDFMAAVKATVKDNRNPRQSDTQITGLPVLGFEDSVVITAEMPVADREAMKMSRTCKHLQYLHNLLYSPIHKEQLMQTLWSVFAVIFVRRVVTMEQRTSCAFVHRFKGALERVYVGAEHQEMLAAHIGTGTPVLDTSGAVVWQDRDMRVGIHYTENDRLEVLPHNRSLPGEPDSRIGLVNDWLTAHYTESGMVMDEVSVLEHP